MTEPSSRPRSPRSHRRPSLADVAAAAGVAPITASRVANGSVNVDARTRDRVLTAMRDLGYRPNVAARALATGRFDSIGVVTSSLGSHGNAATVDAINEAAAARGCSLTLMRAGDARAEDVEQAIDRLAHLGVDGIVVLAEQRLLGGRLPDLPDGVPYVFVDSGVPADLPVVDADQRDGARLATRHLLELGHRTVHHVGGPESSAAAAARGQSWEQTLRDDGLTPPALVRGDWSSLSGIRLAAEVAGLVAAGDLTAVFAANDQMALGLIHGLDELGIRVPEQVSIVGFDDIPDAEAYLPALTTIRQRFDRVGTIAVEQLLRQVEDPGLEPARTLVPVELVIRSSTAPPPGSR